MDILIIALFFALGAAVHLRRPRSELIADVLSDVGPDFAATKRELAAEIQKKIRSGFPLAEQSPEPLASNIFDVRARGSANPCEADFLMDGLMVPYGLGARAMAIVDELQVAVLLNRSVSICDGNSHDKGIDWSHYFANPGYGVCTDLETCYAKRNAAGWLGITMSVELRKQSPSNAAPLIRMKQLLYRQLFSFNDKTRGLVAKTLQDAGLAPGARYVGVHIRRGDKVATRDLPMSIWARAVSEEIEKRSLRVVFVASDEEDAGDELARELEALPQAARSARRPTIIQLFSSASAKRAYDDDAEGTLALLTDVAALRDAEVYIGSHFSYVGRLALFLRDPAAESRSVTGNWLRGPLL